MQFPVYCIIFGRAVKRVGTPDGGCAFVVYSPARDEFEPAMGFMHQILCGNETEALSEEEFEAYVARQRAEAKSKAE